MSHDTLFTSLDCKRAHNHFESSRRQRRLHTILHRQTISSNMWVPIRTLRYDRSISTPCISSCHYSAAASAANLCRPSDWEVIEQEQPDKPQSWERFTDPSLVPERSSLKHQRYDTFDYGGWKDVSLSWWIGKALPRRSFWDEEYDEIRKPAGIGNADGFRYLGWAPRKKEDAKRAREEENHIHPPVRERHSDRWQEEGRNW